MRIKQKRANFVNDFELNVLRENKRWNLNQVEYEEWKINLIRSWLHIPKFIAKFTIRLRILNLFWIWCFYACCVLFVCRNVRVSKQVQRRWDQTEKSHEKSHPHARTHTHTLTENMLNPCVFEYRNEYPHRSPATFALKISSKMK